MLQFTTRGDHFERGRQQAEACRDLARPWLDHQLQALAERFGVASAEDVLQRLQRAVARVVAHIEAVYPEEAPGGLLGIVGDDAAIEVVEAIPSDNIREDERRRRYLIGPDDVLALERRASDAGLQVVGYYHSHPDAPAAPSDFDREHAWPWYVYLIVSVVENLGAEFQDVIINELKEHTYYARLRVRHNGELIEIDARPSDAIAVAVTCEPVLPIYVNEDVLNDVLGE